MTVGGLLGVLEGVAPSCLAFSFDKIGLQVGARDWECRRVAVSLDSSLGAVRFAKDVEADVLLSHHPLIWEPLGALDPSDVRVRAAMELAEARIAFVAAHTNWDCAVDGLNDELAERLQLTEIQPFGGANPIRRFKIVIFTPTEAARPLLDALSEAGAGVIGNYERCAFSSPGTGTFRGNEHSNPTVGQAGQSEEVDETRLEMAADETYLTKCLEALRKVHPYEEPAYDVFPLEETGGYAAGRLGRLPRVMTLKELEAHANDCLDTKSMSWAGKSDAIEWVGVVGGAADGDWPAARDSGADAFLTGEVKQNNALAGSESGLAMIAAGHYATEQPGCERLCRKLHEAGIEAVLFTPEPGQSGRPV